MNRPNPFAFVIGNPLSALAIISGTLYLAYEWWVTQGTAFTWLIPAVGGAMSMRAFRANQQLQAWKVWKRQCEAINGPSPSNLPKILILIRMLVTFAACSIGVEWVKQHYDFTADQEIYLIGYAVLVWLLMNFGIIFLVKIVAALRRAKANKPAKEKPLPVVTVALQVPSDRAPAWRASANLPDHCQELLKLSSGN